MCGKGRDRETGKGREEEKTWEVERKDEGGLTQNKEFHQSRKKNGSRKKEEEEEGLEVLGVVSLWNGMRTRDERVVYKEVTNLTRLPSCCTLKDDEIENENERECACRVELSLKRGKRREGHKRKRKQSRNRVAWRSRTSREKSRRIYSASPPQLWSSKLSPKRNLLPSSPSPLGHPRRGRFHVSPSFLF